MSTRKKRTLANVSVSDSDETTIDNEIRPAVSNFITKKTSSRSQAVRGTEFLVEPDDCKPWQYHNRDEIWLNPVRCQDLISSIRKNGQQFPILARRLENSSDDIHWEIIAGRRRWFACKYLGIKLRVKVIDSADRECAIIMHLENKDRADISEFEDAVSYKRQLEAGLFFSQDDMALDLGLKKSKLSKMLSVANIMKYKTIVSLFSDISKLKINPVYALVTLIEKNEANKSVILKKAESLKKKICDSKLSLSSSVVINELTKSLDSSSKIKGMSEKIYRLENKKLIRAKINLKGNLTLEIEGEYIKENKIDVKNLIETILNDFALPS